MAFFMPFTRWHSVALFLDYYIGIEWRRHRIRWRGGIGGNHYREVRLMPMRPCPRCKRLMPYGPAYCQDCAPIASAELAQIRERNAQAKARKYNRNRDPKYLTFYRSKEWRAQSRAKLQAAGYKCEARLQGCQGLAVEVHHIQPIQTREGWDKRLTWGNLEAVCTSCHNGRHPEKGRRTSPGGVIDLKALQLAQTE